MTRRFLCWFLALVWGGAASAQTAQTDKIRQQVGKIGVLGNITVSVTKGPEYYGSVSRIGADDFAINEVDQRREITLRYSEVRGSAQTMALAAISTDAAYIRARS